MNFEVIEKRNTTLNDAFSCNPQQLDTCGPEAKCEQIKENVYQCICKNDSLLSPNLNCSRIPDLPVSRDQENIVPCHEDGDCRNDAVCRTSSIYKKRHCVCKSDGSSTSSDLKCPPSPLREQPPMNTTHENPKLTGCDPNCGEGLQVIPPEEKIDNQEIIHCVPKQKDKKCGAEGACALVNNTHVCICPQDGSLYYPGRICQLKKVAGVPVGTHKSKFHVDVHTSASLSPSTAKTHLSNNSRSDLPIHSQRHLPSWNGLHPNNDTVISTPSVRSSSRPVSVPPVISEHGIIILAAALVLSLSLLVLILIWLYNHCISFRKNGKTHKDKAFAIPLRKNILTEERYTTNPHYTSAGSTSDSGIPMVPIILRSSITDLEKIGEGFFGKVYKGQLHVPDDNGAERIETVAVKMLKHTTNLEAEEDFMREVEIMSSFEHSNILTLIGLCPRENTLSPWMVFEFMPLGDLASVLRKSSLQFWSSVPTLPALSSESLLSIASQISEGMEYLARQRFVHRDLACRNCLVGSDLVVKIADFGMSRDVYTCDYYKIGGTRMLPVRWMSPESIVFGRFTLESDVWSYGVVLWEIYSYGKQPYYGHSNEEVLKFILDGILLSVPDDCPDDISDIMKACWRKDIKERIMFSEICARLLKLKESMNQQSIAALPRPPPLPVSLDHIALMADKAVDDDSDDEKSDDLLDEDNYLRPISRSESDLSGEYIEPLHMV